MKIVPLPRSSYVRVKPFGAPPDSYFDLSALNRQTPMNGSLGAGVAAGRVVRAAGFGGAFAGAFVEFCARAGCVEKTNVPHESAAIATSHANRRRATRMSSCGPRIVRIESSLSQELPSRRRGRGRTLFPVRVVAVLLII